jgi:hypothetical protein
MYEDLTFLSERQNLLLLEKVFSSTSFKDLKEFLDTFNFKELPIRSIYGSDDPHGLAVESMSSRHYKICNSGYGHASNVFIFRIPNEGIASLAVYFFAGSNNEPIPIIKYFYPTKIINLPFMRLFRDISKCIDIKSHKVLKDPFFQFGKIFTDLSNCKALITIESKYLEDFEYSKSLSLYKLHVWRNIWSDWHRRIKQHIDLIKSGSVVINFKVSPDGKIESPLVLSNTSNEALAADSLYSLLNTDIKPIPEDAKNILSSYYLDLKFCFTFYEDKNNFLYIL